MFKATETIHQDLLGWALTALKECGCTVVRVWPDPGNILDVKISYVCEMFHGWADELSLPASSVLRHKKRDTS